jgi:hypothetical protein
MADEVRTMLDRPCPSGATTSTACHALAASASSLERAATHLHFEVELG